VAHLRAATFFGELGLLYTATFLILAWLAICNIFLAWLAISFRLSSKTAYSLLP